MIIILTTITTVNVNVVDMNKKMTENDKNLLQAVASDERKYKV